VIIVCTIVGARGLYVLAHLEQFSGRWLDVFRTWEGGLTMYGGAVPAAIAGLWYLRRAGVDQWRAADAIAPSLALGLGFTRIGCFLSGCCYGKPTDLPWGVVFPLQCAAGAHYPGTAIHPAQLYASAAGFLIFGILLLVDRPTLRRGNLFVTLVLLYSIARFLLDLVRTYDESAFPFAGVPLTLNQWISLVLIVGAVFKLMQRDRSAARSPS
jgi:phosphatidylglycerol:prolipoprotein diacylglycerol transferase